MRATLFRNPTAGADEYSDEHLLRLLAGRGIDARVQSTKKEGWGTAIGDPGELVVVAGGDGTLAKVAKGLTGRHIPLAVFPIGTANNIATSLGIVGTPEELVSGWDLGRTRPLNVGVAEGPWGKRRFVESVGLGVFAQAIALADAVFEPGERERRHEELTRARGILSAALAASRAQPYELMVDGDRRTGEYLLVEAMSTSFLGPGIRLAPAAEPDDGRLELVLIDEARRSALEEYLASDMTSPHAGLQLCTRRAVRVAFSWEGQPLHIDDEIFAGPPDLVGGSSQVVVRLEEAVHVLVPGNPSGGVSLG
jgi:diacylglycerol kinase (ATP)